MRTKPALLSAAIATWGFVCLYLIVRTYESPFADRAELVPAAASVLVAALLYASAVLRRGQKIGAGKLTVALVTGAVFATVLFQLSYAPLNDLVFNRIPDPSTWLAVFLSHAVPIELAKFVPAAFIALWMSRSKSDAVEYLLVGALVGIGFALAELTPLYARSVSEAAWLRALGPDRLLDDDLWHRGVEALAMPALSALSVAGFAATAHSTSIALRTCAGLVSGAVAVAMHAVVYAYYPVRLFSSASLSNLVNAQMRSELPQAFWLVFAAMLVCNVGIVVGVLYASRSQRG